MRACSTVVFGSASYCRHYDPGTGRVAGTSMHVRNLDNEHESRLLKKPLG
jgi:hypothetical protein